LPSVAQKVKSSALNVQGFAVGDSRDRIRALPTISDGQLGRSADDHRVPVGWANAIIPIRTDVPETVGVGNPVHGRQKPSRFQAFTIQAALAQSGTSSSGI